MLNHIQKLINELYTIDELLSKSELNKIIPNLEFGIEIEMEHDKIGMTAFNTFIDSVKSFTHALNNYADFELSHEEIKKWNELINLKDEMEKKIGDWEVHRDGSLGAYGTEWVSPPMKYQDFIYYTPKVFSLLKDLGFYGNSKTGYHIGVSSTEINLSNKIKNNYEFYHKKYSGLVATILAYNIDSKGLFAQGDISRQEANYSKDLVEFLEVDEPSVKRYLKKKRDSWYADDETKAKMNITFKDILFKGDSFIKGVAEFRKFVDNNEHSVSMTRRANYIEMRGLGGAEAFKNLSNPDFVKRVCVIIASQVSQEPKKYTIKELFKILKPYLSKFFPKIFGTKFENSWEKLEEYIVNFIKNMPSPLDRMANAAFSYKIEEYLNVLIYSNLKNKAYKFFYQYPLDVTFALITKPDMGLGRLNELVMGNLVKNINKIAELSKDSKLASDYVLKKLGETLKRQAEPSEEISLTFAKVLSGTSDILKYIPMKDSSVRNKVILFLFNSGNANDMHNAVIADLSHDLDILSDDQIYKWAKNQASHNYFYTINGYLLGKDKYEKIYDKLFSEYPRELSSSVTLPTEDMVNYVLSGADTSVIPTPTWAANLNNVYLNDKNVPDVRQKSKEMFIKLVISNPTRMGHIDYIDPETQLELVSQKPQTLHYINAPYKATIEKAMEMVGDKALRWVNSKTLKAYQEGGLR